MADQQTLDSSTPPPPPQSDDLSHSPAPPPLSSRLNASAPEFVPTRPRMMMIPPPPPPHMYHHYPPPPLFTGPHERRRDRKKKEQPETGASVSIDPKSGLPEDTVQKILKQVEYYFGDLNLATTDLLMRFISKDPQGYVPVHVVASFNKIKSFINSVSQLATVLQNSSKLVVSEDGQKVRRINPITKIALKELQSRIVIAANLPGDHCYHNLMKIFSAVGSVKNIRTCQPQNSGYGFPSAARSANTDFSNKVHAFVEYETVELAEKAVAELNEERNWRSGLRVRLMLQDQEPKHVLQGGREEEDDDKKFEDCGGERDGHGEEEEQGDKKRRGHNRGGQGRGRSQQNQNENSKQNQNYQNGRGNHQVSNNTNHHPSNYQMNNNNTDDQVSMGKQQQQPPPGPRMPDGTRGFSFGRGKPVIVHLQ